jgi:hypothetical protein
MPWERYKLQAASGKLQFEPGVLTTIAQKVTLRKYVTKSFS